MVLLWGGTAAAVPHDLIGGGDPVLDDPNAPELLGDGIPPDAGPVRWRLDPASSSILALVEPDARSLDNPRSHQHVVEARDWTGHLVLDEGRQCGGEVSVPVGAMDVDRPELRKSLGMKVVVGEWDRGLILEHMLDEEQLHVAAFPSIEFKVDECATLAPTDDGAQPGGWSVTGRLSLHGVTLPVTVKLRGEVGDDQLHLVGSTYIRQTSFDIEPYFALFGQRRNRDAVELRFDLEGAPEEPADGFAPIGGGPAPADVFNGKK